MAGGKSEPIAVGAVLDRYEEDKAVLLVGDEEQQVVFPADKLPPGLDEGDYIRMKISFDGAATERARQEAADLLRGIKERNP